jgi:hypothetical protein
MTFRKIWFDSSRLLCICCAVHGFAVTVYVQPKPEELKAPPGLVEQGDISTQEGRDELVLCHTTHCLVHKSACHCFEIVPRRIVKSA